MIEFSNSKFLTNCFFIFSFPPFFPEAILFLSLLLTHFLPFFPPCPIHSFFSFSVFLSLFSPIPFMHLHFFSLLIHSFSLSFFSSSILLPFHSTALILIPFLSLILSTLLYLTISFFSLRQPSPPSPLLLNYHISPTHALKSLLFFHTFCTVHPFFPSIDLFFLSITLLFFSIYFSPVSSNIAEFLFPLSFCPPETVPPHPHPILRRPSRSDGHPSKPDILGGAAKPFGTSQW